jgi:hypothetical protein
VWCVMREGGCEVYVVCDERGRVCGVCGVR